ncbi:MAG: hypothetical protein R2873_20250 [Caldilineaceae bacterium]
MHLLITSAADPLARTLADQLAAEHTIRLTDRVPVHSPHGLHSAR